MSCIILRQEKERLRRRLLFARDFKKHMDAADLIIGSLENREAEAMSCMDLLLRWVVIRVCDANTQCLLKVLDLATALFKLMISKVGPFLPMHLFTRRNDRSLFVRHLCCNDMTFSAPMRFKNVGCLFQRQAQSSLPFGATQPFLERLMRLDCLSLWCY